MKLRDFLFTKDKDDFSFDESTPVNMLIDLLQTVRAEEMMENDPKKRDKLLRQAQELTKLVAAKTDRPKRRVWTDMERDIYRQRQRLSQ